MARTLKVTIEGQEFTRRTDRLYTHVLAYRTSLGIRLYSWHTSYALARKALAAKDRASMRSGLPERSGLFVRPVDAEQPAPKPKVERKARSAADGPTARQLEYLAKAAGRPVEGAKPFTGNAGSRLHAACLKLGWLGRVGDGWDTALTAAGRELVGIDMTPDAELEAELEAAAALVERVARELSPDPTPEPRWGTPEYEAVVRQRRVRNARKDVESARVRYGMRDLAGAWAFLVTMREQLEGTGVDLTTPAGPETVEPSFPIAESITPAEYAELRGQPAPEWPAGRTFCRCGRERCADRPACENCLGVMRESIRRGDFVELERGGVVEVLEGRTPSGHLVVSLHHRRQLMELARVMGVVVRGRAIQEAREAIQARVDALAAIWPQLGLRFGYVGNLEHWGDDRGWRIFTKVDGPVVPIAFWRRATHTLPELLAAIEGRESESGRVAPYRFRLWLARLLVLSGTTPENLAEQHAAAGLELALRQAGENAQLERELARADDQAATLRGLAESGELEGRRLY